MKNGLIKGIIGAIILPAVLASCVTVTPIHYRGGFSYTTKDGITYAINKYSDKSVEMEVNGTKKKLASSTGKGSIEEISQTIQSYIGCAAALDAGMGELTVHQKYKDKSKFMARIVPSLTYKQSEFEDAFKRTDKNEDGTITTQEALKLYAEAVERRIKNGKYTFDTWKIVEESKDSI